MIFARIGYHSAQALGGEGGGVGQRGCFHNVKLV